MGLKLAFAGNEDLVVRTRVIGREVVHGGKQERVFQAQSQTVGSRECGTVTVAGLGEVEPAEAQRRAVAELPATGNAGARLVAVLPGELGGVQGQIMRADKLAHGETGDRVVGHHESAIGDLLIAERIVPAKEHEFRRKKQPTVFRPGAPRGNRQLWIGGRVFRDRITGVLAPHPRSRQGHPGHQQTCPPKGLSAHSPISSVDEGASPDCGRPKPPGRR